MLKIVILDRSAEARNKISDLIRDFLHSPEAELALLPRVDIKPLSPQEIKFNAAPDLCIIGQELIQSDPAQLSTLRKMLPNTSLLAFVTHNYATLTQVEHLARLGADDVLTDQISRSDFLRKLVMLSRKNRQSRAGKLILIDSAKGGMGATTFAAALAESLIDANKKVVLVDLDFDSQDLSRFVRARPFVNENLALLMQQQRAVTEEFVEQCLIQVWNDEPNLLCMPPVPDSDALHSSGAGCARVLINVFEVLDAICDCIIVDVGCARGAILQTLYRVADKVVYIVGNDPAVLFPTVDRITRMRSYLSPQAEIYVLENHIFSAGISGTSLRDEIFSAAQLEAQSWINQRLDFCSNGQRWPASGGTFYSQAKAKISEDLARISAELGLIEAESEQRSTVWSTFSKAVAVISNGSARFRSGQSALEERVRKALALPSGNAELPDSQTAERKLIDFDRSLVQLNSAVPNSSLVQRSEAPGLAIEHQDLVRSAQLVEQESQLREPRELVTQAQIAINQ